MPRELRGSRQTAGVEVTSRDYSKTSNFVPRRMRKTRPVLSCHRRDVRGTAVGGSRRRGVPAEVRAQTQSCGLVPRGIASPTPEADIRRNPNRSV